MKRLFVLGLVVLTVFVLSSCSSETLLVPSQGAGRVNNTTAKEKVAGITVIAKSDQWNGNPQVVNYVTPVLVTVKNNSNDNVKVEYEQFSLVGRDGVRYSALPPFKVNGTIEKPVLVYNDAPIVAPSFTCNNFEIAPYYSDVYPGMEIYDGPFYFDPMYYDTYYGYWLNLQSTLPTRKMIYEALPEGVIKPGGSVTGFIYFQRVEKSETNKVNFRADLIDAGNGKNFAVADIPFNVVKKD